MKRPHGSELRGAGTSDSTTVRAVRAGEPQAGSARAKNARREPDLTRFASPGDRAIGPLPLFVSKLAPNALAGASGQVARAAGELDSSVMVAPAVVAGLSRSTSSAIRSVPCLGKRTKPDQAAAASVPSSSHSSNQPRA
jgi:hypothetical protein